MAVHRIHLRGPWLARWLTTTEARSAPGSRPRHRPDEATDAHSDAETHASAEARRVKIPGDWSGLFGNRSGRVRFTRRFQCPTNLEPHERVYVTLDGVADEGSIAVNGTAVGTFRNVHEPTRFDITDLLQPTNELQLDVDCTPKPGTPGGIFRHVALEITNDVPAQD